jgi:hypothetical protein
MEPARGHSKPGAGAPRKSASATASRRLQLAPSGYTLGRGSRRAASLGPHAGRVRLIEMTLDAQVAGGVTGHAGHIRYDSPESAAWADDRNGGGRRPFYSFNSHEMGRSQEKPGLAYRAWQGVAKPTERRN